MKLFYKQKKMNNEKKLSILNKVVNRNKLINSGQSIDKKIEYLIANQIPINYRG